jgi:hypothetical protein
MRVFISFNSITLALLVPLRLPVFISPDATNPEKNTHGLSRKKMCPVLTVK